MKLRYLLITITIFLLLSISSFLISGAPLRVHAVDIAALFVAFVLPSIIALGLKAKNQLFIWLIGGIVGLLLWDIGLAYAIVKREVFMGWYIIYPVGLVCVIALQFLIKYISNKLLYTETTNENAA